MILAVSRKTQPKDPAGGPPDQRFVRRTVTLSPDVDAEIAKVAGKGKFSAFVLRAVAHELQRERIAIWLAEREAARRGAPLDRDSVEYAESAWNRRKP